MLQLIPCSGWERRKNNHLSYREQPFYHQGLLASRAEFISCVLLRGNLLRDGLPSEILSPFICRFVIEGLPGSSTSSSGTLSPGVQDRGSSSIILVPPYPEGSSHDAVTSLGSVESGICASSRVPRRPLRDTLADEKSLTTSAPQARGYKPCHSGFLRLNANLRGTYHYCSYAESIHRLEGRLLASQGLRREMGSDSSGTRRPISTDSAGSGTDPNFAWVGALVFASFDGGKW